MVNTFLFRVDGAKDNDEFFASFRSGVFCAYAGIDFRVGRAGWIPDLVKVVVDDSSSHCSLTLIELEATESVALVSCRKYLPENSSDIVAAFMNYLDRVIRQCRSTADTREAAIAHLRELLVEVEHVTVLTAGALRASASFVEELRLIDQPGHTLRPVAAGQNGAKQQRVFQGVLRLSQREAQALSRSILILDAVIRGFDQSAATFKQWRGQARSQPLKYLLARNAAAYSCLRAFIFETRGLTLDLEPVLAELAMIWSSESEKNMDLDLARRLITNYYPIATTIKSHERMEAVFGTAHVFLSDNLP